MFRIGDQVVYGIHGVCRVADMEKQIVNKKSVTYLVLEPLGQEGARFLVPMHNEAAMSKLQPMLTQQELAALLKSDGVRTENWIREDNLRKQTYRELITSGDRAGVMRMVYTLYRHRKAQQAAGRKVHLADDNFLRDAEKLLSGEIAVVMGMEQEQAKAYLRGNLNAE